MLNSPVEQKNTIKIYKQYLIKVKNKGNPDPRKESSFKSQVRGNSSLSTILEQHIQWLGISPSSYLIFGPTVRECIWSSAMFQLGGIWNGIYYYVFITSIVFFLFL